MKSPDPREHLDAYADGELPPDLRAQLDALLANDPVSRAEVERWRAVRASAHRGLHTEAASAALRARVRAALSGRRQPQRVRRLWAIGGTLTAAAAMILLAIVVRGRGSAAPEVPGLSITPESLVRVYQHCAVARHHDPFGVSGASCEAAKALLGRQLDARQLAANVPDLSGAGYRLLGACFCPPAEGLRSLHVYYGRGAEGESAPSAESSVVSFFSMGCRVRLCSCGSACATEGHPRHPQRSYSVAQTADHVTVLKWDERSCSFAVCAALTPSELIQLVDPVDVAAWSPLTERDVAAAGGNAHRKPLAVLAALALAGGALFAVRAERARGLVSRVGLVGPSSQEPAGRFAGG